MKKLLVIGDSYLDHKCASYRDQNIKLWPDHFDDIEVIYRAQSGADNSWILYNTFDAIQEHNPDLVVCSWTQSMRISFDKWFIGCGYDSDNNFFVTSEETLKEIATRLWMGTSYWRPDKAMVRIQRHIDMVNTFHNNVFHMFGPSFYTFYQFKEFTKDLSLDTPNYKVVKRLISYLHEHLRDRLPPPIKSPEFMFSQEGYLRTMQKPVYYRISEDDHHPNNVGHLATYEYLNKYIRIMIDD
tara:strand:- start:63 stop:785 length:723 start_codon:yes stop_codon:yes gene_type:complete